MGFTEEFLSSARMRIAEMRPYMSPKKSDRVKHLPLAPLLNCCPKQSSARAIEAATTSKCKSPQGQIFYTCLGNQDWPPAGRLANCFGMASSTDGNDREK